MIKESIIKLIEGENLTSLETKAVFEEMLCGSATLSQMGAFLTALKIKGATIEEIAAAVRAVRGHSIKINARQGLLGVNNPKELVMDTCGTGGSGTKKFNISTTTGFVIAAAAIKVAKHGNRAMSGHCGSADVLEELGIKIDVTPTIMELAIKETGFCFMFAPLYHPAFKHVAPVRKELGVKTVFNILGPMCNPASASHQVIGVYDAELIKTIAQVLADTGTTRALVLHGKDFKDEVSLSGETQAILLDSGRLKKMLIKPSDFGLKRVKLAGIEVADCKESAALVIDVLAGKKGPCREMVLASSACAFFAAGRVKKLKDGVALAAGMLDCGAALRKFEEFKKFIQNSISVNINTRNS